MVVFLLGPAYAPILAFPHKRGKEVSQIHQGEIDVNLAFPHKRGKEVSLLAQSLWGGGLAFPHKRGKEVSFSSRLRVFV